MTGQAFLVWPLTSAVLFAFGAIFSKRAIQAGIGAWRMTAVNAWVSALLYLPLWLLPVAAPVTFPWYQAVVLGLLAFLGNLLTFLALSRGDVSVATPVLGLKVILVAVLTVMVLRLPVPVALWVGAGLAVAGLFLLRPRGAAGRRAVGLTVVWSLASATTFAVADILVQRWMAPGSFTRFAPAMFVVQALAALVLVARFRASLMRVDRATWRNLLLGGALIATQGLVLIYSISRFGEATAINIAYSTRGIWSVLLVWVGGRALAGDESGLGPRVLAARLVGASLLLVAVVLVLL